MFGRVKRVAHSGGLGCLAWALWRRSINEDASTAIVAVPRVGAIAPAISVSTLEAAPSLRLLCRASGFLVSKRA